MTPFMIFFIVLTLGYILYYAAIITIDLNAKPKDGTKEVEDIDTEGIVPDEPMDDDDDPSSDDLGAVAIEEESSILYQEDQDAEPSDSDDTPLIHVEDDNIYGIKDEEDTEPADEQPEVTEVEQTPEEKTPEVEIMEEETSGLTDEQIKEILPDAPDVSPESLEMADMLNSCGESIMAESPDAITAEDLLAEGFLDSVRELAESDYALTPHINKA